MLIGGFQKSSLIDFKGKIAAIVFLQGCNFSCPYCHNPELVIPMLAHPVFEDEIFAFLKTRINKLDGVVISGGEPTIHKGLDEFIKKIKDMGFAIKLDTNGTNPSVVQDLLDKKLLDYIAMDIKTSINHYKNVVRREVNLDNIKKTMELIVNSGIDYEFRTTVVKELMSFSDFEEINKMFKSLAKEGKIKRYYLQKFQKSKHVDENFLNATTFEDDEFNKLEEMFKQTVDFVMVR